MCDSTTNLARGRVTSEADAAEREDGHGGECTDERRTRPAAAPLPRAPLEQRQPQEHERHGRELADGGITQAVQQRCEHAGRGLETTLGFMVMLVHVRAG